MIQSAPTRFVLLLGAAILLAGQARAQPPQATQPAQDQPQDEKARESRISAATSSAIDALGAQIAAVRITPNLTVLEFLDQTDASVEFENTLHRARQVGGPRWLDDQTCQVKVEIDGRDVSSALVNIAMAHPNVSPLPAQVLSSRLRGWKDRSFSATGISTTFERAVRAKPRDDRAAWDEVTDDARTNAVALAKLDAATRLLDSVKSVELGPGVKVADALAKEPVRRRMTEWLASRPITRIDFRGDLLVEVRVAASADDVFDALSDALQASDLHIAIDDLALVQARRAFERQLTTPVGMAYAALDEAPAGNGSAAAPGPVIVLPDRPPAWVQRQLDAEGVAPPGAAGSRLRVQRTAQLNALDALRKQIGALPLNEAFTLDEAGRHNPRLEAAIDGALVRARVFKVDYRDDGSVLVRVVLDGRDLWDELDDAR